jgi:hypothetical protein
MDLYAITYQLKAPKHEGAMPYIGLMMSIVFTQKLRGLDAFGCKYIYIDIVYWLSKMTVCMLSTMSAHPITFSMSLR